MKQPVDAVFENGAFRPLQPEALSIPEGRRVRITVDDEGEPEALRLAMEVYDGLSAQEIADVEVISLDRGNFFGSSDVH